MSIGMYVEQFCSLFCTAVVPNSEVLVHQMVTKELNSSDICRLIPYTTVCGHATAARKHVAEDHEKKISVLCQTERYFRNCFPTSEQLVCHFAENAQLH
jgi:hypothetical protein